MSDSNESTPKKEWCLYCFQYLKGKQLRRRLLPQAGEAPRCEICGEVMTSCGCRPRGSLLSVAARCLSDPFFSLVPVDTGKRSGSLFQRPSFPDPAEKPAYLRIFRAVGTSRLRHSLRKGLGIPFPSSGTGLPVL